MQEKVLIVEDETDMADLLKYNLTEKGYHPVLSSNGREALEIIEKEVPDLVLLDLMMEQVDGWEVCSSIRSHTNETIKRLPIIMLTALSEAEEKIIGLRLGADDYVTKPFNMDELILRIQNQLRKKRVEDELMERLRRGNDIPALFYHEVKNQLMVIGAYSHLIAKESITRDKKEQFSEILNNTASAISEYLEGMSLFSKLEKGEKKIRLEKFSLREALNKIILSYKNAAVERKIRVETDYTEETNIVELNSIAMKMVLSNLIGNAIKYNKKNGSVLIKVEIASPSVRNDKEARVSLRGRSPKQSMFKEGSRLIITIEDTGLGIDPVDIPHIFDKFYRSRSVDGHIDGTGIGLYIVKTLVNAMEGEIEVESTLGKGSKFTITLNSAFGIENRKRDV